MAKVRDNVTLIDKENTLTTEYIDYDFSKDLAYYINGGKIVNGNNTLESEQGYYYSKDKLFFFKDSVKVVNPEYTMYSDTLKYNTVSEIAYFLGPTDIISKENYIYCENGWYDTQNNISQFNKNAFLESEGKILRGDSLYYERENGLGKAFYNVEFIDTSQNIILQGNYALYYEHSDYAMLTDSALMIQVDGIDSLFIHADTLKTTPDTLQDFRKIQAYYHVKIFREDLQGKCDSLTYTDIDSIFRFFGEPVIWSDENQITAEFIEVHIKNQKIDHIDMTNSAFIISQEDETRFNQIKGRDMVGYFVDGKLNMVDVDGNGQTLYFVPEEDYLIGANKAQSSNLKIYLKDNKVTRINFITKPDAVYYPIDLLSPNDAKLENFRWYGEFRPLKKMDAFKWQ
jgi:lipopolysaccharide export system protein LptA